MKSQLKGFVTGVLVTLALIGSIGTAMATVGTKAANLEYSNIQVTLDGAPVNLVDVNGNPVEPFIISGTTYLPVRAVAGAFGLEVDWDGATQTVILKHPSAIDQTPNPTQNPVPSMQPIRGHDPYMTVYVSNRSNTIHSVSDCSGMRNYREMKLYEAEAKGYAYCNDCW